jgi:hypothetical protein
MSFVGWTENLSAMADRFEAIRKRVCAAVPREIQEGDIGPEIWWNLGGGIFLRKPPTFTYFSPDNWWYVQGKRFVGDKERREILRKYWADRARALFLAAQDQAREAQQGGGD